MPPGYPAAAKTNGLAVAALVLGCVAIAFCFVPSILAIVFGYISKSQIDRSQGTQTGRGLAIAGIVLGWVGVGLALLVAIALVIAALVGPSTTVNTHTGTETLRVLVHAPRVI
jgi:hypothetical protein